MTMKNVTRTGLVAVVMLGVMGMVSSAALAAKGAKGAGHGAKGIEQIRDVLSKLNLSEDQQKQTDEVLNNLQEEMQKARADAKSSGDKSAAKDKAKSAMMDAREKLLKILTPDQQTKFKAEMKEVRAEKKADKTGATTKPADQ
jgi:Spy/CpxP family protein refolding chaperone